MTALVPLNNAGALPRLSEAGVGEIYVGFHDDDWGARFGAAEINRMSGFGREANPFDFQEMCAHIGNANQLGMRAFVCFNAGSYTPEQIDYIAETYLAPLAQCGAQGVILSSQALAGPARAAGLGVVISTVAGVFNERIAAYYRDLGATRIILPRDMSAAELEGVMLAVPEVEYEVFLMRNGCMFSDSHCLGCHRAGNPSLCMSLRTGEWEIEPRGGWAPTSISGSLPDDAFIERARYNEWLLNTHYHRRTCGLCALWRFEQMGVSAYKVVGRGDDVDDLVADAALVVRNTEIARACATEEEYLACMELPRDPGTLCGMNGLSCYYPEIPTRAYA